MQNNPFIQWMKQVHGKISSTVYSSFAGINNTKQLAFIRNLEKDLDADNCFSVPITELNVVVFDFETTGFFPEKGDRILSIGAIKSTGTVDNKVEKETYYSLVHFDEELSPTIKRLTGLQEADLKIAPSLDEVLLKFYEFVNGAPLVAHHASHERRFLQQANRKLFRGDLRHRIIDTSIVFRVAEQHKQFITLEDYCAHHGIDTSHRHHALHDAKMTELLWCHYIKKLEDMGFPNLQTVYEQFAKFENNQKFLL